MDELVKVEVKLCKADFEKLVNLAGGEGMLSAYMARMIQMLHGEAALVGGKPDLYRLFDATAKIAQQNCAYHRLIHELEEQIKQVTQSQAELQAQIDALHGMARGSDKPPHKRKTN